MQIPGPPHRFAEEVAQVNRSGVTWDNSLASSRELGNLTGRFSRTALTFSF